MITALRTLFTIALLLVASLGFAQSWQTLVDKSQQAVDPDSTLIYLQKALDYCEQNQEIGGQLEITILLGKHHNRVGLYSATLEIIGEAVPVAREYGLVELQCSLHVQSGLAHYYLRDYDRAQAAFEGVLRLDSTGQIAGHAHNNLGLVHLKAQNFDQSRDHLAQAEIIFKRFAMRPELASNYLNQGVVRKKQSQYETALQFLHQSAKLCDELGDSAAYANALIVASGIHRTMKNHTAALDVLEEVIVIRELLEDRKGQGYALNNFANVHLELKHYDLALEAYQKALVIKRANDDQKGIATTLQNMASVHVGLGNIEQAISLYRESYGIKQGLGDELGLAYSANELALHLIHVDRLEKAEAFLSKTNRVLERTDNKNIRLRYYEVCIEYFKAKGEYSKALEVFDNYSKLYSEIYNEQQSRTIAELQEKYERERSNREISELEMERKSLLFAGVFKDHELLKKDANLRLLIAVALIVATLLLFAIGIIAYTRQRQKLRTLVAQSEGQEMVRTDVSRNLHDSVSGTLAGLRMKVQALEVKKEDENLSREITTEMNGLAEEIRKISHQLAPVDIHVVDGRFSEALSFLLSEFESYYGITVKFDGSATAQMNDFSERSKSEIYRIIQELLHNVYKHADSDVVEVSVSEYAHQVVIQVRDEGQGFNPESKAGIGLKNIEARLKILRGSKRIESNGDGATVTITIPIKPNRR